MSLIGKEEKIPLLPFQSNCSSPIPVLCRKSGAVSYDRSYSTRDKVLSTRCAWETHRPRSVVRRERRNMLELSCGHIVHIKGRLPRGVQTCAEGGEASVEEEVEGHLQQSARQGTRVVCLEPECFRPAAAVVLCWRDWRLRMGEPYGRLGI